MEDKNILSIDVGGTGIKYVLIRNNKKISTYVSESKYLSSHDKLVDDFKSAFLKMQKENGKIFGISISFCSPIVNGKDVTWKLNLKGAWESFDIKELIAKKGIISSDKVVVINDAKAAIYAENKVGAGVGYDNLTMLTYGTAIGGAAIVESKIVNGKYGLGSELSFPIMGWDGDSFESVRSWASYANMTFIQDKFFELSGEWKTGKEIFDLYDNNDSTAKKVIDKLFKGIAIQLFNCCYIYGSEAIIIGGGLSNRPTIVEEIYEYVNELLKVLKTPLPAKILRAKLSNDAGAFGAYYYFIDEMKKNN